MKKIIEVRAKTLEKAWDWAEKNQDNDPVAKAFVGACFAIGMIDRDAMAKRLGVTEAKISTIDASAFEYRNALAREIIKILKQESK